MKKLVNLFAISASCYTLYNYNPLPLNCADNSQSKLKKSRKVDINEITSVYQSHMFPAYLKILDTKPFTIKNIDDLGGEEAWIIERCEKEPTPQEFYPNTARIVSEKAYWKARTARGTAVFNIGLVKAVNELINKGLEPYIEIQDKNTKTKKQIPILFAITYADQMPKNFRNPLLVVYAENDDSRLLRPFSTCLMHEFGEPSRDVNNQRVVALFICGNEKLKAKDFEIPPDLKQAIQESKNAIPNQSKNTDSDSEKILGFQYDLAGAQFDIEGMLNRYPCAIKLQHFTLRDKKRLSAFRRYTINKIEIYEYALKSWGPAKHTLWTTAVNNTIKHFI